jgi:hypothetical protein
MKTISFCLALLMHTTLLYAADGDLIVNGKLGVGSTNPSYKLEISGNAGSLGLLGIPTVAPGNNWAVFAGNVGGYMPPSSRGLNVGWNRSNFQGETNLVYGSSAGTTPRMEIGSWDGSTYKSEMVIRAGNVGIGVNYLGAGGGAALLFANGSMPTSISDVAGLYANPDYS